MNFIEGLSKTSGKEVIFVVVERFSKYARSLDDHTPSGTTWEFASDGIAISIIYPSGQGSMRGGEVATSSEERSMESHIIFL